ncbi:MAG: twin-arginine translocation signal domain-containing protein, partial [Acidiferrobacterales bacterium]
MKKNSRFTRRDVMAGAGAGVITLSLGEFLLPGEAKAAKPKKGGKLVYAGGRNTKHKTLKKAKHPYYGIEIR